MNPLETLGVGGNGIIIRYNGENNIDELLTRNKLVERDIKLHKTINEQIQKRSLMHFMPNDINEINTFTANSSYILQIFGVLADGSKAEVNLTDVPIFFDVLVPECIDEQSFYKELYLCLQDTKYPFNIIDITAKCLHGFSLTERKFKRVFTYTTIARSELMSIVGNMYDIYSNDKNHYYRKAARENLLTLSDWVTLEDYEYNFTDIHIFTLSYKNYKTLPDSSNVKTKSFIQKDRTLIATWDIETYSTSNTGLVPMGENDTDSVFMICLTFHWVHEFDALYQICIVDKETESDSRWTTIVCHNQENIIKAFAIVLNCLKPDIIIGFNDSGYDWKFIMHKCIKFQLVKWFWDKISYDSKKRSSDNITKYNFNVDRNRKIKINAEKDFYGVSPIIPGMICIDALPCFMKIYPKLETSRYGTLKSYLQDNNLPTKVDLPIITLWKYYREGIPKHMREIAYYCIVDSISVQRLFVKRGIIMLYRETSTLAYVSLADTHYYAGGIKVCNLVGSYAFQSNILVNMKPKIIHAGTFPGAHVFNPEKGIVPNIHKINQLQSAKSEEELNDLIDQLASNRPVVALDFASLYPSLIITYNLSPEMIIKSLHLKEICENKGLKLHEINFNIGNKQILAWSVMHNNNPEQKGLFPIILEKLFNKRQEMKTLLKTYESKREIYDLIKERGFDTVKTSFINELEQLKGEINVPLGSTLEVEQANRKKEISTISKQLQILNNISMTTFDKDYIDICFNEDCINKKQNALKIYMNTFYGETGNHLSPFFSLELAGGVTSAGQNSIKLVANFVREKKYGIKYGDSVMSYTPIVIKSLDDSINVVTFNNFNQVVWVPCLEYKYDPNSKKECFIPQYMKIWTSSGWSPIVRIIRHFTTKRIYRVITNKGLVDVTEDHSLLDINKYKISPIECTIGKTKLLYNVPESRMYCPIKKLDFYSTSQLQAQIDFLALQNSGKNVIIGDYINNNYLIQIADPIADDSENYIIKSITLLHETYTGYVYDVETRDGTFQAGIGNLIVKNTDSLYLTCPNEYFRECDLQYASKAISKEVYFTAMVKITLRIVEQIEKEINSYLVELTGSNSLRMANEGCMYPCVFLGKKKYFGIKHFIDANFSLIHLYVKGLEIIKQGKSKIEKKIGSAIMHEAVNINNDKKLIDIVKYHLEQAINMNTWEFDDFIQTSAWKPTVENISVKKFMQRMAVKHALELKENELLIQEGKEPKPLLYTPLEPGDRFSYVLVKNDMLYDYQGKKINVKVGDIMEYAHVAKQENMQIDTIYYLIHYVIGTCARFISSDDQFLPSVPMDDKKADEYSVKMAKKMLEDFVRDLNNTSKSKIAEQGKHYKKVFKEAVNIITPINLKELITGPLITISFDEDANIIEVLFKYAKKEAIKIYKKYLLKMPSQVLQQININTTDGSDLDNPNQCKRLYNYNGDYFIITNGIEYQLRQELNKLLNVISETSIQFKTELIYIVKKIRDSNDSNDSNENAYLDTININIEFVQIWKRIIGFEMYKYQNEQILELIQNIKFKRTKTIINPNRIEINNIVKEASKKI